ncbi:unnamed protein product [Leuciscus chuanchicus]
MLRDCGVTDEGCSALASALRSNPSHLRDLNLSVNKLGDSVHLLSAVLEDPHCKLDTLRLFYIGPSMQYMRLVVLSEEKKRSVLTECHNNPGTGNHSGVRGTQNRVIAGYYWSTIIRDVKEWVKEAWEVLGLDLIGPLPETARNNKYVLTMTDLYTKWVIAAPLQSKTAAEVSANIIKKLYLFGTVRKIITDQGKEFVNKLNSSIFSTLNIKHAVSSAYHPQTNGQYSTRHSPYFLLFNRHPRLPEVMNACPMGDDFEVTDPEDDIDTRVNKMKLLNETAGDDVLLSGDPKKRRTGDTFTSQHKGPFTVASISSKGVATIAKGSTCQRVNVSRLRTYYRSKNGPTERMILQDHCYSIFEWQIEHPYACSGAEWEKDLGPIQDELLKYVLDKNRPSGELIIKQGKFCLTREEFWSLGLSQCMESNVRFSSTVFREFLCCLHADVCSQYLYFLSINIHRGGGAIDSPVVVHSTDGEVLPRRGNLEPVFRVSKSTTTELSLSKRVVVEEDTDKPIIVRDLLTARDWVRSHGDLFCGKCLDDMETFLSSCADEQGLKVNAMFVCS